MLIARKAYLRVILALFEIKMAALSPLLECQNNFLEIVVCKSFASVKFDL